MPAPKKAAAPKKTTATAAAKPAAKKPAPAKKPAVAKKAPTAPVVKAPAAKPALKAPAKPTAVKKPVAKIGAADGIKKTAIPAKVTEAKKPVAKSATAKNLDKMAATARDATSRGVKAGLKPKAEVKAAVAKALPVGFSNASDLKETVATARPSDLGEEVTVLSGEPTDHVVLAHTNPLGSDYTVNFFAGVKGGSAYRQMHLTATQKSKKRLSIEQTINSVLKAALGYENKRSQGKAFRGITALSVVVTRNSTSVTQPLSILLHLNPLQAMAF